MKRSYPYTGPGAAPNQAQPQQGPSAVAPQASQPTPDYSAYGYGTNSAVMSAVPSGAGLTPEAQQAQWHQQWQQYYAQQAASGASTMSRPPQQQILPAGQPFPQYQAGPQAPFFNQQYGQQAPIPQGPPMQTPVYAWPGAQQQPNQFQPQQSAQGYVPHQNNTFQQPNQFNQGNIGPAAKRPRFGANNQQQVNVARPAPSMRPMNGPTGNMQFPPGPSNIGPQGFPNAASPPVNANWQAGNMNAGPSGMRGGPMRGGGGPAAVPPHVGGPSNMAGPMALNVSSMRAGSASMADRRGGNAAGRPQRPGGIPNRPGLPAMPTPQGKFNGPVGVNAVTPQGRPGMGGRPAANGPSAGQSGAMNGSRRPVIGLRNGIPSGPSGKGARYDNGKGKASPSTPSKGSSAKSAGGFELHKAPAINGKGSTIADQPVPASAKRTFSDFKITEIQIEPIGWHWYSDAMEEADDGEADGMGEDETMQSINDTDSIDSSITGAQRRTKHGKRNKEKADSNKEANRLRICFAATQPPPDAPTGPKALQTTEETEKSKVKVDKEGSPANQPEWTAFSRGPPQSSTNRISISYASSRRRLVIDSNVIKKVEVNRAEQTMKIVIEVTTAAGVKKKKQMEKRKGEEWVIVKGVLLEAREADVDNFGAVSRKELESAWKQGLKGESTAEEVTVEDVAALDPADAIESDTESVDAEVEEVEEEDAEGEGEREVEENDDAKGEEEVAAEHKDAEENDAGDAAHIPTKETAEAKEKEASPIAVQDYASLPPFYRLLARHDGPKEDAHHTAASSRDLIILISLAEMSIKQEPRWVKSGDVEEWLSALPGFHSSLASAAGNRLPHAWSDKIYVVDPDPPPTLQDVLLDWSTKSFVGGQVERTKFIDEYRLHTMTGMTELLCKLIRGDRATPTPSLRDLGDPLKDVLGLSPFPQSHLTLSIVALIKMMQGYAEQSGEDNLEEKMQGIIMCLPTHQIFRACDGLLKEVLERQRLDHASRGKAAASGSVVTKKRGRDSLGDEDVQGVVANETEVKMEVKAEANGLEEVKVESEDVKIDADGRSEAATVDDAMGVAEDGIKEESVEASLEEPALSVEDVVPSDPTLTNDVKIEEDQLGATVSVQASEQ